jgi:hypothetical protein
MKYDVLRKLTCDGTLAGAKACDSPEKTATASIGHVQEADMKMNIWAETDKRITGLGRSVLGLSLGVWAGAIDTTYSKT